MLHTWYLLHVVPIIPNVLYELGHGCPDTLTNVTINASKSEGPTQRVSNITSEEERHRDILRLNSPISLLYATKAVTQLIFTPFIGPLTNRFVYLLVHINCYSRAQ